jgi:hypothetical protein
LIARHVALWRIDLMVCSTATRAKATAKPLLDSLGCPVRFDEMMYAADANHLFVITCGLPEDTAAVILVGHNPSLASKVSGWSALGENTAKAWSASQAETLFMGSAGHRANILKASYNRVGIGVTKAKDGSYWFTVDFEQTSGYHAPAPTHSTHPATHHSTTTSTRSSRAARSSRSSVRSAVPAVAKPAHVVLVAPATGRLDSRLTAIDARLSTQPLALPLPPLSGPRAAGPDPSAVALVVSGGLLVTALAAIATTRPPRVRVRGLSTWK